MYRKLSVKGLTIKLPSHVNGPCTRWKRMPPVLTMVIRGVAALGLLTTSAAIVTRTRLYMLPLDKNGTHDMQYVCRAHPNNVERFNAFRSFVIWVDILGPGEPSKVLAYDPTA